MFDLVLRNCLCLHILNFVNSASHGVETRKKHAMGLSQQEQLKEGRDGLEQLNCLVLQWSTVSDASKKTTTLCTKFHCGVGFLIGGHYRR